jgi:hypothetical protein
MLWGYFASTGFGAFDKVNGIMNFTQYQEMCQKPSCLGRKWIFQQENNLKNTLKSTNK